MIDPKQCDHPGVFPFAEDDKADFACQHCGRRWHWDPLGKVWLFNDGPTRTRPEDQVLPDGDESIPDDQSLLVADIEARRQVGISRYGQGHRPFNGRHTLKDLYEEQLDFMVYLRSIVRMSEAVRGDLIAAVATEFRRDTQVMVHPQDAEKVAEVAVNRIMGWVDAQIIGANPG